MIESRRSINKLWKLRLKSILEILKSKTFAVLVFNKQGKETGVVEGYFTKGFTRNQMNWIMNEAQYSYTEKIIQDNYRSIVDEATEIINKKADE